MNSILSLFSKSIFYRWVISSCLFSLVAHSTDFTPGVSTFDSTGHVEYIPGNAPVIISVPHGGDKAPVDIPNRDCSTQICGNDGYTQELARSILNVFFQQNGTYPHMIINRLQRRKFDANRDIREAANGNATVEKAWYEYHDFIDLAKHEVETTFGRGLFLDLHGHSHSIQRVELGYLTSANQLRLSNEELDASSAVLHSSMRSLVGSNHKRLPFSELIRGEYSFGSLLQNKGIPAIPSQSDPYPEQNERYFNGGFNTFLHGSRRGGSIDSIQIECHRNLRFNTRQRENFAHTLSTVVNEFINYHYNLKETKTIPRGYVKLYVEDVVKSLEFYKNAFDLKRKFFYEDNSATYAELGTDSVRVALANKSLAETNLGKKVLTPLQGTEPTTEAEKYKRSFSTT